MSGGGIVDAITDPISDVLGTSGDGGGILGAAEDVGQAVGSGLADVDTFVNRELPGGWALPAAIAAAYATGYIDPSLFATEAAAAAGAEAGAGAIATEAGQTAFFEALASGASSTQAVNAGLAADAALNIGALTTDQVLSSTGFTPAPGSGASFAIDPTAAYTTASTGAPIYDYSQPLYPEQFGPTYQELGYTGVEGGFAGPTYEELGYTGLNQTEAIAAADAAAAANAATALKISPLQAIQGLKMASGLLSGGQQGTPAGATAQFIGSSVPQGSVDYSGILNLLQTRAQQRNPYSLLG